MQSPFGHLLTGNRAKGTRTPEAWRVVRWGLVLSLGVAASSGCGAVGAPARQAAERARPNVLFICIDDLRPELGCYGVDYADSPHLDAFAATAARFENHFVQAPSCGPSRYALLTGRSPLNSGALRNDSLYRGEARLTGHGNGTRSRTGVDGGGGTRDGAAQTFPELFRQNGYRTVCIGKVSHTPDGRVFDYDGSGDGRHELPGAWDELATPFGIWGRGWGAFFAYAEGVHREDGTGRRDLMEFTVDGDGDLPDGLIAEAAAAKLRELAAVDEPFLLGVGFFKPHLPFVAPRRDRTAISDVVLPAPPQPGPWKGPTAHGSGEFMGYHAPFEKSRPLGAAASDEARRAYLACVRYVDRQVGVVLEALEDAGLAEDTVVVIWGDHGWHLGDSGVWGKHTLLDRSLRSALLMRVPGLSRPGSTIEGLAASIDLYPTLVAQCGLRTRATRHPLDGVDLSPLIGGEVESVRREVHAAWGKFVTIRTMDHRVIGRRADDEWSQVYLQAVGGGPDPVKNLAKEQPDLAADLLKSLDG